MYNKKLFLEDKIWLHQWKGINAPIYFAKCMDYKKVIFVGVDLTAGPNSYGYDRKKFVETIASKIHKEHAQCTVHPCKDLLFKLVNYLKDDIKFSTYTPSLLEEIIPVNINKHNLVTLITFYNKGPYEKYCNYFLDSIKRNEPDLKVIKEEINLCKSFSADENNIYSFYYDMKAKKTIQYIKQYWGKFIIIADSTTLIIKPFINDLLTRIKNNDILKCPEFFKIDNCLRTNIGFTFIKCNNKSLKFFESILQHQINMFPIFTKNKSIIDQAVFQKMYGEDRNIKYSLNKYTEIKTDFLPIEEYSSFSINDEDKNTNKKKTPSSCTFEDLKQKKVIKLIRNREDYIDNILNFINKKK